MRGFFLGILMWLAVARCVAQEPPPNDYFTNRIALTGPVAVFGGDNSQATWPDGDFEGQSEPSLTVRATGSLWWSWTAIDSTPVIIERIDGGSFDEGGLGVYTGTNVDEMLSRQVAAIDLMHHGQFAAFQPEVGTEYQIQVGGYNLSHPIFYRLIVTNSPVLRWQPQTQTVTEGASTIFTAFAIGVKPLYYQWRRDGADIPGATNMMISFDNITTNDAAGYRVVITNSTGSVTSRVAQLYVTTNDSPAVLKALGDVGKRFRFSVSGEEGRRYRLEFSEDLSNWVRAVIMNTNPVTSFVLTNSPQKRFFRLSAYHGMDEICINHMRQIRTASWLFAEDSHSIRNPALTENSLAPYLIGNTWPLCPMNQGYPGPSYGVADLSDAPTCRFVLGHRYEDPDPFWLSPWVFNY